MPSTFLLEIMETIFVAAAIVSFVLIQPFEGEGRGERHPGRRRRSGFYTGIFLAAYCVCQLMAPHYKWQPLWAVIAFISLGRTVWTMEGRRLRRYLRKRRPVQAIA